MGLSGPRKRVKISHDPNNTAWSRSTTGFGHTILRSQGWAPGETLGAKNAHHRHLHSAASSSHIRVAFRDDNLGLGAKKGSGQDAGQCTGLDAFQGLLGRLNGKSEEVLRKEQSSRDSYQKTMYVERRWGMMRFVSGGILEGSRIESVVKAEDPTISEKKKKEDIKIEGVNTQAMSELPTAVKSESDTDARAKRRSKKDKRDKKEKKKRKRAEEIESEADEQNEPEASPEHSLAEVKADEDQSKQERKEEKARRKEEKARRKLERQLRKAAKLEKEQNTAHQESSTSTLTEAQSTGATTPIDAEVVATKLVRPVFGRHAVRQRFIQQKKLAIADQKSLNEIFMIKA